MTPTEALAFLRTHLVLPPGATVSLQKDKIIIGNADANFVLRDSLLLSEESIILAVNKSMPHLEGAMKAVADGKAAAAKIQAELKEKMRLKLRKKK